MTLTPLQRRGLAWAAIAATALWLLWLLAPVLAPFVAAAVLAYALHPAVELLAARRVPRLLAVAVVEAGALTAILGLALLVVPILVKELPLLREQLPLLVERLGTHLQPWLASLGVDVKLDLAGLRAMLLELLGANVETGVSALLRSALVGGSVLLALVGYAILVPVVLFYLLSDWARLVGAARAMIPPRLEPVVAGFLDECDGVLGQYLRGQLLVMLALAFYYAAGLRLAGLDLWLPVGVFTGLAIFIPYVGYGLGLVLALLAAALQFASLPGVAGVVAVYAVGQLVESFVLTPRLVGERIGLAPLAVIFALMAFGQMLGFVGVLVALPVSAVLLVALRRLRATYLASRLYRG